MCTGIGRNNKGFSLIEIVVALGILSFGLLGSSSLIGGISRGNHVSKTVTVATTLAEEQIESVLRLGYTNTPSTDTTTTESTMTGFDGYSRVTKIYIDNPATRMKKVVVEVHRPTGSQPIVLASYIAR